MGPKLGQMGLVSGANDFGGTLMEESISKAAGSEYGDNLEVVEIERLIREIGRVPYERTTDYVRRTNPEQGAVAPNEIPLAPARPAVGVPSGY